MKPHSLHLWYRAFFRWSDLPAGEAGIHRSKARKYLGFILRFVFMDFCGGG